MNYKIIYLMSYKINCLFNELQNKLSLISYKINKLFTVAIKINSIFSFAYI
jgi:hypothetical protein